MSIVSENLKHLRKNMGLTQEQMAQKAGIKRSLLGAYEEGRADPRISNLIKFSEIFGVPVDQMIASDLGNMDSSRNTPHGNGNKLKVLSITVDENDRENIELVPQKAAAGYLNGYADPEYIEELPKFQLPILPKNATYRAFEISGDSMLPLTAGTIVIGQFVEDAKSIKNGKTFVFVTQKEGVVYKRVYIYKNDLSKAQLVSDNKEYSPYDISLGEVMEIWEAKAFISMEFPSPEEGNQLTLKNLAGIVLDLQQEVIRLKNK